MIESDARLRFATVADLYAAFPTAAVDVGVEASACGSVDFVRAQTGAGAFDAALSYCAYLLSRRCAVWWACACVRASSLAAGDAACVDAAESWALEPSETARLRALALGRAARGASAAGWAAKAAGWSGGDIGQSGGYRLEPAPQATAQAARGAVLIALGGASGERLDVARDWAAAALRLALGDGARQ
jgi:hypothetical protein